MLFETVGLTLESLEYSKPIALGPTFWMKYDISSVMSFVSVSLSTKIPCDLVYGCLIITVFS